MRPFARRDGRRRAAFVGRHARAFERQGPGIDGSSAADGRAVAFESRCAAIVIAACSSRSGAAAGVPLQAAVADARPGGPSSSSIAPPAEREPVRVTSATVIGPAAFAIASSPVAPSPSITLAPAPDPCRRERAQRLRAAAGTAGFGELIADAAAAGRFQARSGPGAARRRRLRPRRGCRRRRVRLRSAARSVQTPSNGPLACPHSSGCSASAEVRGVVDAQQRRSRTGAPGRRRARPRQRKLQSGAGPASGPESRAASRVRARRQALASMFSRT